jgi:hypothetical protein
MTAPSAEVGTASPWSELRRYERAQAEGTAEEFSFDDLLDVVNPLQHIPVVSTVYRELTGDQIGTPARVLGGGLYGGAAGVAGSVANAMLEEASGRDVGGHVMAAVGLGDEDPPAEPGVQTAQATGRADPAARASAGATAAADTTGTAAAGADGADSAAAAAVAGGTASQASQASAAGADAPLTGAAALQALARDLGGGGTQTAAAPAAGREDAASRDASGRTPPSEFMPIAEQHRMSGYGQRRSAEVLRASADPLARHRGERTPDPQAATRDPGPATARPERTAAAASDGTTGGPAAADSTAAAPQAGAAHASQLATPGDFAERMRMALEKYEAMRRRQ